MKLYVILISFLFTGISLANRTFPAECAPKDPLTLRERAFNAQETIDVPFAVVEVVPVFPGCDEAKNNFESKQCFSENFSSFLTSRFNTDIARQNGLSGLNRIFGQIRINSSGEVDVLGIRSPHPAITKELERVLHTLPKMIPGKQRSKKVGVLYSFPFTFKV